MTTLFGRTPACCKMRRQKLLEKLAGQPALIGAGAMRGRNYAGNPYPFRASSHFLYLLGDLARSLPGTWLLLDDQGATLFAPQPDAHDALWHGAAPSLAALAELLDVKVRNLNELVHELERATKHHACASLPALDAQTAARQQDLLGRAPTLLHPADQHLAQAMIELRLTHDEDAQAGLREAAEATVAAHAAGMASTRAGLREWEVMATMTAALAARGMTTAYNPIVSVHGEVLHNNEHHNLCQDGDLLLADVGAETRGGWAGDVTRTWPVSGKFSRSQREIYEVVLASQQATIAAIKPGARYRDLHLQAATVLTQGLVDLGILQGDVDELVADDVHALFFPHGVGHLLGLDVHDMEDLGDRAGYASGRERSDRFGLCYLRLDRDLLPGMAVTIEPGFYQVPAILENENYTTRAKGRLDKKRLAAFADVRGIRLEDDILVTHDGAEVLTAAIPITIDAVEAAVGGAAG